MNLNRLRFFVAVSETLSFSRAAGACCVTQPTLSNGIANLEDELGGRVFERNTRKVQLTPFGEHLLPAVRAVLDAQTELAKSASTYLDPALKMIRIGQSPLVDATLLAMVLEPFKRTHANVDVFFKECFLDDLDERIAAETVDIGFRPVVTPPPAHSRQVHCAFYEDPLYFLPWDTGTAPAGEARLNAVATDTFVLTIDGCGLAGLTEALFKQHGWKLHKYPGQALSYQVLQDWANLGVGSAILPLRKFAKENRERAKPLLSPSGDPISVEFEAVWKKDRTQPKHIADLQHHFASTVAKLVQGVAV